MPGESRSWSERVTVGRPHWRGKQGSAFWKCWLLGGDSTRVQRCDQRDVYIDISIGLVAYYHTVGIPMKHDPLGDGDNAVLRLAERGQLRLDGIVGVGHDAVLNLTTRYTGADVI